MRRVTLCLCFVTIACGRHGTAPDSPTDSADGGPRSEPPTASAATPRELDAHFDNATPADLIAALERASGRAVQWDDRALPLAVCTTVTVHRDHLDVPALADVVARAIRPVGLILAPSPTGWSVQAAPDAPREPCSRFLPPLDASAPEKPDSKELAAAIGGVHQVSPTRYTISKHTRAMIADPAGDLLRVRIIPEGEGGIGAFRFFGIRPTDLLGALGFLNGDQVESLCGKAPDTGEAIREAFAALDGGTTCVVEIVRRGAPLTLTYTWAD
ncbi:MAG TPA: hypothetical protein VIF09_20490 [Polyangiaceae bacterium]